MRSLMSGVVLVGVLVALPAVAEKPRVVVLDFTSSSDELKRMASSVAEQMLTELSRTDAVEVLGTSDVVGLLGMERQRQLLGCTSESSSCLAEISAAMGAPWLVMGNLAQLGKVTRLDVKLIRAADGKAVLREGKNLSDESEVFDLVNAIVGRMLESMQVERRVVQRPSPVPWVLVGGGAALAVGGGALLLAGAVDRGATLEALKTADPVPSGVELPDYTKARASLGTDNTLLLTGAIMTGAGLVAAAAGVVLKVTSSGGTTISVVGAPGAVLVRGQF